MGASALAPVNSAVLVSAEPALSVRTHLFSPDRLPQWDPCTVHVLILGFDRPDLRLVISIIRPIAIAVVPGMLIVTVIIGIDAVTAFPRLAELHSRNVIYIELSVPPALHRERDRGVLTRHESAR